MIRFQCPACNAVMTVPPAASGKKGNCPRCGQRLQVPAPAAGRTVLGQLRPEAGGGAAPVVRGAEWWDSPPPVPTAPIELDPSRSAARRALLAFLLLAGLLFFLISGGVAAVAIYATRIAVTVIADAEEKAASQPQPKADKLIGQSPPAQADKRPVKTNGMPTVHGAEQMMMLENQVGVPSLGEPPVEVLEYYKDITKPRFYKGESWRYRPPTREEQLAVIAYWAHQREASVFDKFTEWHLACVYGLNDVNDDIGKQRSFQVTILPKKKDCVFLMDSEGKVCMVIDLKQ